MVARSVKVGDAAPGFALPAAQGRTFDLGTYKGQNVILWFTKGFGCPFCRQQMSQLARAAPRFHDRKADVLQITPTPLERARLYARNFKLPFAYLCDVDNTTRQAYGLGIRHNPVHWYLRKLARSAIRRNAAPVNEFGASEFWGNPRGVSRPSPRELHRVMSDEDSGFFIVDGTGIVRFAEIGAFREQGGVGALRQLPDIDRICRVLEECKT
jgi:peroxiredoxin